MAKRSEKFCDFRVFPNVMVKKKRNGVKFSIGCSASRHCEKIFNKRARTIGLRKDIVQITINDFQLLRDSEAYKF